MPANPIDGFTVDPTELQYIGEDLQRPECILAERDGSLWVADARGGVVYIRPDGSQRIITQSVAGDFAAASDESKRFTEGTLPNGLAFAENGDILISNFGTDLLEVMTREGETRTLYDQIDGQPIGKVNFVLRDSKNRIWITVSTRVKNWMDAAISRIVDGYVALVDERGIRIVADGFAFTNEIRLDAAEEWLYVVETTGRKVTRLKVAPDGELSQRETYGPEDTGGFIDGIAFDAFGNLWGTHILHDRLFAITPDGDLRVILDDTVAAPLEAFFAAFAEDRATPDHMLACGGSVATWMASITFGGPDLRTAYIGSLRGTRIPYFRSPVAGLAPVHW
ncbi:MAG: SMP-30/gluconolactonase/LRE family protein [Alphaproteobacteria bacterium]|jgi:sugar lactone lactonase YvrE|nr:SMP-30/gluconolactonase/LRE family protein [Alphaproteobacteria bacterium]|tara:strand:- start:114 stop:1124 length:1011 start_codon:yes stop_codon:yes gene_type:complete